MAAPMRDSALEGGHRAKVADARTTAKPETATSNFEYDDNEWDIGIGDLIIDLDADIEKTNEGGAVVGTAIMASTGGTGPGSGGKTAAKMAIEHSATVDKGLKMKIKRTKPGTKTSEAKHEIVKSNELNGGTTADSNVAGGGNGNGADPKGSKHPSSTAATANAANTPSGPQGSATTVNSASSTNASNNGNTGTANANKRGSSSHRRDKGARSDKHASSNDKPASQQLPQSPAVANKSASNLGTNVAIATTNATNTGATATTSTTTSSVNTAETVNGIVRTPQQPPPRAVFPASTGPGPPPSGSTPGPPPSPAAATTAGSASKPEQTKVTAVVLLPSNVAPNPSSVLDERSISPPPAKKIKTNPDPKDMVDVCVGTSVGTITEPDCLGPCEPGTSVTLEGIVWHETEGGVLVVNVTWRGKTYVGTLLDCTRHDWAPPRFCDSPTSDLDARTPKGRGKRGRAATVTTPGNDLSNFTETRSSVHSKLRNGGAKGRRGGSSTGSNTTTGSSGTASPTPFIPPRPEPSNKRKSRNGEEEPVTTPTGKKSRVPATVPASPVNASPPASPVLLECPEPNCSKKYKHINGLKYHQSHAHGSSAEDDDTKDVTSMSENDESNIEAPSPATPVKSPEKVTDPPSIQQKKEDTGSVPSTPLSNVNLLGSDVPSQPSTPKSRPSSPPTPQSTLLSQPPPEIIPTVAPPPVDSKNIVKPGVLRFGPQEDFTFGTKSQTPTPVSSSASPLTAIRTANTTPQSTQPDSPIQTSIYQSQQSSPLQPTAQLPGHPQPVPGHHLHQSLPHNLTPLHTTTPPNMPQNLQSPNNHSNKIPQFKVKPTAALMPDDKKDRNKPPGYKKKNRKSPAGSPHPQPELPSFGGEPTSREDVQSPAYSDISDDNAPVMDTDANDKNKVPADKKTETGQPLPHTIPQYGLYPFYGQPPYLVPSVQPQPNENKSKETDKSPDKMSDKDPKKDGSDYQQKVLQQHYYPYGYMQGYPYNIEPPYGAVSLVPEDKIKEERIKESSSPAEHVNNPKPIPNPIQVPTPAKVKTEPGIKEKHQNENHQILKESIEIKNQMSPYIYSRPPQSHMQVQQSPQQQQSAQQSQQSAQSQAQQAQQQNNHNHHHHHQQHQQQQQQMQQQQQQQQQQQSQQQAQQQQQQQAQQREEEMRRYYLYPEQQRRKESEQQQSQKTSGTPKLGPQPSPSIKHKDKSSEDKKDKEVKQEGVKPTMETQGPPPPPTSQYAYIHPSYMQSPGHYSAIPFDPNHPMYRSMLMHSPYGGNPYLHPQIPRYHAPEDLSRPPQAPTKALDLLQHHANQYYTSHKIHELQERAMKSPTPKTSVSSASPSNAGAVTPTSGGPPSGGPPTNPGPQGANAPQTGKPTSGDGKDSRSPPPQRHVHTHHHTHVGLGYPILAGQYPAPYGAAVLASQQAAAVTVINPYPPK